MEKRSDKKLVIVINGRGGVGKDTLCEALCADYRVTNISAITPIKEIASVDGWRGEKDEKSRRFLAELKRVFVEYNDLPNRYLVNKYEEFAANEGEILCVHIRESDEIEKFVKSVTLPCITLLVKRKAVLFGKKYGNAADDGVENYCYDYEFDNDDSIEVSSERFRALIRGILNRDDM